MVTHVTPPPPLLPSTVPIAPTSPWAVGVVVPACDEADHIEACIRSVRHSLTASGAAHARVVVVADSCADDTADRARTVLGPDDAVLTVRAASVGLARSIGTAWLLDHLADNAPHDRTWFATTDADSTVPADWLDRHLTLADAGAAAVAGIVEVSSFTDFGPEVAHRHRSAYVTNLDGSHPHVHGANLGVRADAYLDVGGWPPVATAEDHGLWNRLRGAGWPTISSTSSWVTTSGRRTGRAPSGFAGHLAALEAAP